MRRAEITPDGSRVVFSIDGPGSSGTYSSPIDGSSQPVHLFSDPAGPAAFWDRRLSPDGSFLLVRLDVDGFFSDFPNSYDFPETHALYAVATTGGPLTRVTDLLDGERRISGYQIASDSRTVIYTSNQENENSFELFRVVIPEPGSVVLLATGGLGLLLFVWRRRKGRRPIP